VVTGHIIKKLDSNRQLFKYAGVTPVLTCPFVTVFIFSGIYNPILLLKLQPLCISNIFILAEGKQKDEW
jgi:hypothetical protein